MTSSYFIFSLFVLHLFTTNIAAPALSQKQDRRQMLRKNWKDFIPARTTLVIQAIGDLNKDGLNDVAFVYRLAEKKNDAGEQDQVMTVLFKRADGNYQFEEESKHNIAPYKNMQLFFTGLEINKGILITKHEYLHGGGCTHKYRYQDDFMYLIGASANAGNPEFTESIDYNLNTGAYLYKYNDYTTGSKSRGADIKKGRKKLKRLPDMESFNLHSLVVENMSL